MADATKETRAAHTPGEWRIAQSGLTVYALNAQRVPVNRIDIALNGGWTDTPGVRTPEDELFANARLIAAAPDLLAACQEAEVQLRYMREYMEVNGPMYQNATSECVSRLEVLRAAIDKATGAAP